MSELHRTTYEVEKVPEQEVPEPEIPSPPAEIVEKSPGLLDFLGLVFLAALAQKMEEGTPEKRYTEIKTTEGGMGKGNKITAKTSNDEEVEVVFMPNGEIMTHVETPDIVRCQQLAKEVHEDVLKLCQEVAGREGYVFKLKSAGKKPAFLSSDKSRKAVLGNSFTQPQPKKLLR